MMQLLLNKRSYTKTRSLPRTKYVEIAWFGGVSLWWIGIQSVVDAVELGQMRYLAHVRCSATRSAYQCVTDRFSFNHRTWPQYSGVAPLHRIRAVAPGKKTRRVVGVEHGSQIRPVVTPQELDIVVGVHPVCQQSAHDNYDARLDMLHRRCDDIVNASRHRK